VIFWSNHFSMTINKSDTVARHARPARTRRDPHERARKVSDMQLGVMKHPAIARLFSTTPDSIGRTRRSGKPGASASTRTSRASDGAAHDRQRRRLHRGGRHCLRQLLTGWSYVRGWEADGHYNGATTTTADASSIAPTGTSRARSSCAARPTRAAAPGNSRR